MQQSQQEVQNYQEDEIDLKALVFSLIERKFLIAGLTGFVTILTILYALTLSPNYQATTSFTSAPSSTIAEMARLTYIDEQPSITKNEVSGDYTLNEIASEIITKNSIFTSFLTSVSSQKLQKNVFLENDFITVFNKNNDPIEDIDEFISNIISSIKINPPQLKASDMALYLNEKPYSVSVTGSDKKAISRYLDLLINQADKENIMKLSMLNNLKIENRLDEISLESKLLIEEERVNRLNQIVTLTAAAKLARSLGVVENNLNIFKDINAVNIAIGESNNLPDWYLYGEKALLQRIDILVNRSSDEPYIPKLILLNIEKDRLKSESSEYSLSDVTSINLISSKIKIISTSKRQIVLIAFIVSFMMSIFLVLIMSVFKPNEKEPLPK